MNRKNILWLASWYPNATDLFDGDFIQRHAKAAAIHHNIHVLFIKRVTGQLPENEIKNNIAGLTEEIIYYQKQKGLFEKPTNYIIWRRLFLHAVNHYIKAKGKPNVIHVHIPWKAGLIALELKKRYALKYIVTEHWGIYNTKADDNITTRRFLVQQLWKRIIWEASALISVSNYVGRGINKYLIKKPFTTIPNVVDTGLFYYSNEKHPTFTFLHVSNMVALKNIDGILDAFEKLVSSGCEQCRLIMIGNRNDLYVQKAEKKGLLNNKIYFLGELPYADVAKEMRQAHAFILNSHIENAPCVISEALCCGVPVIATKVGGIPEMLTDDNGILIKAASVKELLKAMAKMLTQYSRFNKEQISETAVSKYSYESVSTQFEKLYNDF